MPNHYLDTKVLKQIRFFPREPLNKTNDTLNAAKECADFFKKQTSLLAKKQKISLSLTAGLDSRLSLAAAKELINDVYLFTFKYGDYSDTDCRIAEALAKKFKLNHKIIPIPKEYIDKDFLAIFRKSTSYMSHDFRGLLANVIENKVPTDRIQIKSNGSAIARLFYKKMAIYLPPIVSAHLFSQLYVVHMLKKSKFIVKAFKDFIKTCSFQKKYFFNYDLYDLFYWEQKMGKWQALSTLEYDLVHETFIPFYIRHLL
jgi:hypothetical protein